MNAIWASASATIALVVIAAAQAFLFVWQLILMRQSSEQAKVAAQAAQKSADAAERALVEYDRPWIFRGPVKIRWRDKLGASGAGRQPNNWYLQLSWRNIGRQPAIIDRFEFKIAEKNSLPPVPDYSAADVLPVVTALPGGDDFSMQEFGPRPRENVDGETRELVVFGRVLYREMTGKHHVTGFALALSPFFPAAVEFSGDAYNYYR